MIQCAARRALLGIFAATTILFAPTPARSALVKTRSAPTGFDPASRLADVIEAVEGSNLPNLIGMSRWQGLVEKHRQLIESCQAHARFAEEVNELFADTGISHFQYYTEEDWSYWHIRSTFGSGDSDSHVEHIGVIPQKIEGRWFIRGVLEGSAAAASRVLLVGDELISVDGRPFEPIASFRGKAGKLVRLTIRRKPGAVREITIKPVKESLYKAVQEAVRRSIRVMNYQGRRFAYLHGWTLLGPGTEYRELLRLQPDVDGLILDYRDGFGGTPFLARQFLLGHGSSSNQDGGASHWVKPVVILTADGTRSAKEIVVNAVQRSGRAPLLGSATPGDVTSVGGFERIGPDALLMLPGIRFSLEDHPTIPDFTLEREIRYCAGVDGQLDLAKELLSRLVSSRTSKPAAHGQNR